MKIGFDGMAVLIASAVAAAVALLGFSAFASDVVKTDVVKTGDYAESERQADEGAAVKTGEGTRNFWRAIDEDGNPVKASGSSKRSVRAAEEDVTAGKAGDGAKSFWRAVDDDGKSVKSADDTRKPRHAIGEAGEPNKSRPAGGSARTVSRSQSENRTQVLEPAE